MPVSKRKPTNVAEVEAPEFQKWYKRWCLIDDLSASDNLFHYLRDVIGGSGGKNSGGFLQSAGEGDIKQSAGFMSRANASDVNNAYKERAVYMNVVGNTLDGMIGLAFSNNPTYELPPELEVLDNNADGTGLTLEQQAQEILRGVMMFGRVGVLVDFPKTDGNVSKAQMKEIFPTLLYYPAKHIREWRTTVRGSKVVTSLVVLSTFSRANTLLGEVVETRLALGLDGAGNYYQEKFVEVDKEWFSTGIVYPTDHSGAMMTEIPWVWAGSETNSHRIDKPPLLDIATVNKAHYNASAIYEDSVYMCGQPQPWMSGITFVEMEQLGASGFRLGAGELIVVPPEGQFAFAQVEPNTLASESLKDKLQMMLTLGARLIQPNVASVVRTATEVLAENVTQNSVLSLAANNTSDAIEKALRFAQQFVGGVGESTFEIDTQFAVAKPDGLTLELLTKSWATGGIALSDLWDWQFKNRFTQLDYEEWKAELKAPEIVATDPDDGEGTPQPNDGEKVDET